MDAFIAPLSTSIRQPTCPHYALRCSKFHGFAAHPNVITPPKRAKSFVLSTAGLPQPTQKCIDGKTLLRLAVLVSGSGRSLENICQKIETSQLTGCQVCVVVTSKSTAAAVQRAEKYHIPTRVVRSKDFPGGVRPFSDAISAVLDDFGVDLVVMAGWLHFYQIPPRYDGKVINIHPSLIPAFCGKGFYGKRVHEAVVSHHRKILRICDVTIQGNNANFLLWLVFS